MTQKTPSGPVDRDVGPAHYAEAIARRRAARKAGNQSAEDTLTDELSDLWRAMTPEQRAAAELMCELDRLRAENEELRAALSRLCRLNAEAPVIARAWGDAEKLLTPNAEVTGREPRKRT